MRALSLAVALAVALMPTSPAESAPLADCVFCELGHDLCVDSAYAAYEARATWADFPLSRSVWLLLDSLWACHGIYAECYDWFACGSA